MKGDQRHSYRFKAFRLEVEERQLLHHDHPVALTPKAFDVLVALVERSGHLVEKDELMQTVWSDSFVEEANIARLVHTIRKTLGDDGNGNKYIETVAKKGYRFVVEVMETIEPAPATTIRNGDGYHLKSAENLPVITTAEPPDEKPLRIRRSLFFIAGFVSAMLLLFSLLVEIDVKPAASLPPDNGRTIAVLPLKPVDTAQRDELYEIGVAESLIQRLRLMKGFVIRPLSATRKYAETGFDPLAAGKEQQVDYVLASSYQMIDGKICVTAQLVNVPDRQIEETYKIEQAARDGFAARDAVALELGDNLMKRFAGSTSDARVGKLVTAGGE